MDRPIRVVPDAVERVWGGSRLRPGSPRPIGELWVVGPATRVADGPLAGRTLEDVARAEGEAFLGPAAQRRHGPRFPLLLKLLDPAAWLSVQVHPDDMAARRLAGPDAVGKTEAWYVLEAKPGAELLIGTRPDVDEATLRAAMAAGAATTGLLARHRVSGGEACLIPAGTLHAVGPGVLLYEIQQPSDLTYRVDDWGRPPTSERPLHRAESLAAVDPASRPIVQPATAGQQIACPYFALAVVDDEAELDPAGRSVQIVTAVDAPLAMTGRDWAEVLAPLESIVVPASARPCRIDPGGGRAIVAHLP